MIKKYVVYDQRTGSNMEASTFEEAVSLQINLINSYMDTLKDAFAITVMVNNEDGSWSYYHHDENGDPVMPQPAANIPTTTLGEGTL